ncbi:toll/interleukin-1 receptor domain-containing protein [Paraburkholderia adhaesiva]|uniref:toll/interleukin-1 receptor domain-containing protein n=1 Tax=Paraburkholderia adhaesiva TaxID=2883244 RepID=UPI001F3AFAB8|nr:toll/interleukin-1 receptor domain-containing protein [Paraburkholderia adhaesiva]
MNLWARIRSTVRGAQSAIASEPKQLAPLQPMVEDALAILAKNPSEGALNELEYLLTKIQEFVVRWRPSPQPTPGIFYVQPGWARSTDEQAGEALSILKQLREDGHRGTPSQDIATTMKVFVSHSSIDAPAAQALVEFIRAGLNIGAKEIRCTSVAGYKLSAGADSNEQLRAEVFECEAFIALLSPSSMVSTYVMFELGARWGARRYLAPVMIGGTTGVDLRAPLSAIHAVSGSLEADLHQLLADLAERLGLQLENPSAYLRALQTFAKLASVPRHKSGA